MKKTLMFIIASWFCSHGTIINEGDFHNCMYCGVEVPEGFSGSGIPLAE
jgi:hypothetical protein